MARSEDFRDRRYGPLAPAAELAAELDRVERSNRNLSNVLAAILLAFYAWLFRDLLAAVLRDVLKVLEGQADV